MSASPLETPDEYTHLVLLYLFLLYAIPLTCEGEEEVLFLLVWLTFPLSVGLTFHEEFSKLKIKSDHTSA